MDFQSADFRVKIGLAEMLKGGVIMDVTDADQAKIAEDSGAAAVMALERIRESDPEMEVKVLKSLAQLAPLGISAVEEGNDTSKKTTDDAEAGTG